MGQLKNLVFLFFFNNQKNFKNLNPENLINEIFLKIFKRITKNHYPRKQNQLF